MAKKGSSAPAAPDPKETSAAQTGTNVATAIANTMLGNINQVGADGSTLNYDQTGSYSFTDPYTGQTYDLPTFTATQSLSDAAQGIYDTNMETQANLANLGRDQSAFLGDYLSDSFSYDPTAHMDWAGGLYDDINSSREATARASLETQLANQGIVPGSKAYDDAMSSLVSGTQTARDQFMLDSYNTGLNTTMTERSQPINEISALLSGSQINLPNYATNTPSGIPTTDNAGLITQKYNQDLATWQNEQAQRQSVLGGLFGLGSSVISGGFF